MQVRAENLYYLLSYAWRCFDESEAVAISAVGDAPAEQILVRALCSVMERLLRRQLDRGYREERDELRRPRGRIDVSLAIARSSRARGVLPCVFDELTEDVVHNQILKSMLARVAIAERVDGALRLTARRIASQMVNVGVVELSQDKFQRLQLGGNLRRYRLPLAICALLHRCLLPHPTTGGWQLQSFAGDEREMGLLFEAYVRAFMEENKAPFLHVGRSRIRWIAEGETASLLPGMSTDITLTRAEQTVLVETKCYGRALVPGPHGGGARLRSHDVCQLAAYLANFPPSSASLSGALVYAVDKPTVPSARFRLLRREVHVREIDIAQPWQIIERDMRDLMRVLSEALPPDVVGALV